jgi:demethylmenaquinone methyltransferase/2-methoxy-6-polyprenyl-1,4-benzoquinol methylase
LKIDKSPSKIAQMFDNVAFRYDLMNDLMTGFSHRITRRRALKLIPEYKNLPFYALDLATGTGDFIFLLKRYFKEACITTGLDFSPKMLAIAKSRASKAHLSVKFLLGNILQLPFESNSFEICTIGYGIRNVNDMLQGLREIYRVTKHKGTLLIVEATPPQNKQLRAGSTFYFSKVVPLVAKMISPSATAYKYFAESVKTFPIAPDFAKLMRKAGWRRVTFYPVFFGTVTIFQGFKTT